MTQRSNTSRIAVSILLIAAISGCSIWNSWFGSEEINVGEYLTLQVEDTTDVQSISWVFSQLPDTSKLSGFLPSDTVSLVSFVPDVPGGYEILVRRTINGEVEETKYSYEAVRVGDSTSFSTEIPQHLVESGYNGDTTVSDTQDVSSLTDQGDQRRYLAKIVSPDAKKAPVKRKATPTKKRATPTLSRGNLIPLATKTFTIQVSSWPSLEEAQSASDELLNTYGIDSYIQRAFFKDKDEVYFRLRVGNFKEQTAATAYAKEIQEQTSLPVWVDWVRKEM